MNPFLRKYIYLFILILISFYFVIFGNWIISLTSSDEGKNAFVVLNMLKTKNYLVPYYNCEVRFEKPPMLYWVGLINSKIFGLNEFSLRLVSGLSAIGVIIFSYLIIKKFFTDSFALKCVLILLSFPHVWIEARSFVPEMLLNFFSVGGIYFFLANKPFLGWLFWGFGVLTKGPVGIILPFTVILFFKFTKRELKIFDIKGLLIFFLVGGSWYLYMIYKFGYLYFYKFFLKENIFRYTGKKLTHPYPFYYYFIVLILTSFFYLPAYYKIFAELKKNLLNIKNNYQSCIKNPLFPFVLWFLFVLIFYSFSKNKLHHYILFTYPPLTVILAKFISEKYIKKIVFISGILLLILIIGSGYYEKKRFLPKAKNLLKEYKGEIYFYKVEVSALPFYLNKCIPKLSNPKKLRQGIVITLKKYEKSFKDCNKLLEANEFGRKCLILKCKGNL